MDHYWIGTSGFDYPEWRGPFYPPDLPREQFLAYYAQHFPTVEINNTFYRMPKAEILSRWGEGTPARFTFALKAPKRITHDQRLKDVGEPLRYLGKTAQALGPKLGPLLFQLPPYLRLDLPRLTTFLGELPPGIRAAVEFRHPSWFVDEVFQALKEAQIPLVIAEAEEFTTPLVVTAGWGYLRLRREDYGEREIQGWAGRLREHAWREVYVYLKHEAAGRGPELAQKLQKALARR